MKKDDGHVSQSSLAVWMRVFLEEVLSGEDQNAGLIAALDALGTFEEKEVEKIDMPPAERV